MLTFLRCCSERLDDFLRFRDLRAHRTVGGPLEQWCGITRHSPGALYLPAMLCALLVLASPSWPRAVAAAVAGMAATLILIAGMRFSDRRNWPIWSDVLLHALVVGTTCGVVWLAGSNIYQTDGLYQHLMIPVAAIVAISLLVASALVSLIFRRLRRRSNYSMYLQRTELFASRGPAPTVTPGTMLTATVLAFVRAPLALLTIPAIAILVSSPVWMTPVAVMTFIVCFAALWIGGLNERFGVMWHFAVSALFTGGATPISVLIILLAIGRITGNTYLTTIFDTIAWRTLGVTALGAYVLAWWYDYWVNRLVTDQILTMLGPVARGRASVPYPIDHDHVATSVPEDNRVVQIHGSSRFMALQQQKGAVRYFQSHTVPDLLDLLTISGAPGGKAKPTALQVQARVANFHAVAAVTLLVPLVALWLSISRGRQLPEVTLSLDASPGLSLNNLLGQTPSAPDRPLLVVAASGGGTRAALYTAAVLEGLGRLGRAPDIVLGSGVSGGGAALAYFAGHRPRLATATPDTAAWEQYFDVMAQPFIQDVIDRAPEWRIVSGGRLGMLLADSFKTRWTLPPGRQMVTDINEMGLLFNTSLAGHFKRPAHAAAGPLVDIEPEHRDQTKSTLAGGRLLLTNLDLPKGLDQTPLEPDVKDPLPVIVRSRGLRLEEAAALNANFPPVFSNAAIDVDDKTRYWVTDGGAVDNRGLEMLLYAMRLALDEWRRSGLPLPAIHVVIADASAFSDAYGQDRGIGSAFGAGSRYASHLNAELAASIRQLYQAEPSRFRVFYMMMPNILRESGSFGTHWMLQRSIRVRTGDESEVISGHDMIEVLRALHSQGDGRDLTPGACAVLAWSRRDSSYELGWSELLTAAGTTNPPLVCAANGSVARNLTVR